MNARLITEFFTSTGYGVLSAFVPVFNAELYVVATQALGLTAEVTAAIGVTIGQTLGKLAIVLGLRHGSKLPLLQRLSDRRAARLESDRRAARLESDRRAARSESDRRAARSEKRRANPRPPGRVRRAYRRWSEHLLELLGESGWSVPIVFLSALIGVPPLLAVQFMVPATKMPIWVFTVTVLLGRLILFLALAFGVSALIERLWP